MEDMLQKEEISLMDLLKVLWSKIKLLILVCLCGGIIGGAMGFLTTYNENYWGASMEFYVNPERPESEDGNVNIGGSTYGVYGAYGRHVMDNIVKLLNSESFAEKLILNGSKLPEKNVWVDVQDEKETALNLNPKIDEAQAKIITAQGELEILNAALETKNDISIELSDAKEELNDIWYNKLFLEAGIVSSSIFNEREYFQQKIGDTYPEIAVAYQAVDDLETQLENITDTVKIYQKNYSTAKKEADKSVNVALVAWRKTAKYRAMSQKIMKSVEFSYLEEDADMEDASNLARSFIYVNISVLGDENKEFAEDLMVRVQENLPIYVSAKMIIPDGYTGTSCTEITTTSEIDLTNPMHTTKSAIKFAVLFALMAVVIASVVIIIIDRSDKRVRDYDQVSRMLNIPLLGVIPSIAEESMNAWNNETQKGKSE